jgi:DNA-binding NarL/FixJ family response regulator
MLTNSRRKQTVGVRSLLPARLRILLLTPADRSDHWLAEALANDSASDVTLEATHSAAAGASRLREEAFDCVLAVHAPDAAPDAIDALEFVAALRAGGAHEPLIVLGDACDEELAPLVYEAGGDGYACLQNTAARTLLWLVARAMERCQLLRENQRYLASEAQRLELEKEAAEQLLSEQRTLLADLAGLGADAAQSGPPLPERLVNLYRELLRTYVLMGTGNVVAEMRKLARLLAASEICGQQTLELHLNVLEELVRGLGARSARHVLTRADLLALEVLVHLADAYREAAA